MALKLYMDNPDIAKGFEAVKATLPGADRDWLNQLRAEAMTRFADVGIPGAKIEEWKYTPLGFLANENFPVATAVDKSSEITELFKAAHIEGLTGPRLVFVNGYIAPDLSLCDEKEGVRLVTFSENPDIFRENLTQSLTKSKSSTSFNDLNRALVTDGYALEISENIELKTPVQVIHIVTSDTDMTSIRSRCQVMVGENAKAEIMETFIGADGPRYWFHMVNDVSVAAGADLKIYQQQLQGRQAIHMTELHSTVAHKAAFSHTSLQLGAEVSRTELINSFSGEYANIELYGAYLGRIKQSHDIFTRINHDTPNCQSNQLFRGVLDEGGKSAYQGKVVVAQDAQKTNADQSNKNLLLSRKAEANAKPELLIYADDVKCSHGATVGELDPDQLFYMRSRGMDDAEAKSLLVEAFVSEVFDNVKNGVIADSFKSKAAGWLSREMAT